MVTRRRDAPRVGSIRPMSTFHLLLTAAFEDRSAALRRDPGVRWSKVEVQIELVFAIHIEAEVAFSIFQEAQKRVSECSLAAVDVKSVAARIQIVCLRFSRKNNVFVSVGEFNVAIAKGTGVVESDGGLSLTIFTTAECGRENGDKEKNASEEHVGRFGVKLL